jgi:PKD repeat protein
MAIVADFTVSNRVGDLFNTVTFTDMSVGVITSRKWILGDGTVLEGNDTTVKHTYFSFGKFTVTLVVQNVAEQDSEVKEDYIIVNDIRSAQNFIVMQSFAGGSLGYWRLYLDINLYIYFETKDFVYRSISKVTDVAKWTLVQFDYLSEKMLIGSGPVHLREIPLYKTPNTAPMVVPSVYTEIAAQSTLKLDELKIWSVEKDLNEYFRSTRGRAVYLDLK